jgi:hypothetical protein
LLEIFLVRRDVGARCVQAGMAKEIIRFQKDFQKKFGKGYVIHPDVMTLPLGESVVTLPLINL